MSAPPGGVELDLDATVPPRGDRAPRPTGRGASELPLLNSSDKEGDPLVLGGMLGKGGAGFVQVAWQTSLERDVAVKRIRQRPPGKVLVDALIHEARLSGALEHPNIIPVHDLGRAANGEPLLVMKRVEGVTWDELLNDTHHPAWDTWRGDRLDRHLQILIHVCRALEFAHSKGVIHLDIKPANIMIGDFGETWLMDWGVAIRLEDREHIPGGQIVGTPAFMAPEMLLGRGSAGPRSDVFLLGAVLHQVLTGRFLFSGPRLEAVLFKVLKCATPRFDHTVPDGLAQICAKACEKHSDERYPSVEAFRMAIEDFLEHRGAQRLIDAANQHRDELVRVLDASGGDSAALRRSADSIAATASQARFGYEQALLQWPGNREALDGLQDVVQRAITLELDRQNLAAVAPLFEILPEPVPALKERYASLREALKVDLDARAALSEIRSESRFEAGDWNRSIGMLVNGTLWAVGVYLWGRAIEAGRIADPERFNMWVAVFGTITSVTVIVLLRRLFLDNRVRRAFSASYLMFILSLDLNRVAALFLDIPFSHTLIADHVVLLMFQGMLAAFAAPTLWAATGVVALGMLAGVLFPIPMMTIAAVELLLVNLICGWALRPRSAGGQFA